MSSPEGSPAGDGLGPLATSPDEVLVFAPDGRLVDANPAALRTLGTTPERLGTLRAWEVLSCLTPSGFGHLVEAVRAEGHETVLGHLRRGDGSHVAAEVRLWKGAQGEILAQVRALRARGAVLQERDRLAHLVEASSEAVLLFDRERRVGYANRAALELLGFERAEDLHGVGLHDLVGHQQRAFVEERIVPELEREGWNGELELRSWRERGVRTPCWVHAFAVNDTLTGKRVGYAMTALDISARHAAEERRQRLLRLAEVSRQVALHLLSDDDLSQAVFVILAGVARVLDVKRAYLHRFREDGQWLLRTHEWSPEEGPRHQAGGPADLGENYVWASSVLQRGEPLCIEDAVPISMEARGRGLLDPGERALLLLPVMVHGRLESVFGFVHDHGHRWQDDEIAAVRLIVDSFARGIERRIAERERARALRALEEAVEREKVASRFKSDFLASMSHELRTPMNAIRGYAELLARPNPERSLQSQWIRNLRRSTEYLLGLIHDVLDLSKIEAGHMRLERQPTALPEILASVEDLLAGSAREKGLAFSIELEGVVPESFDADPVRLKQILVNLSANAIKFTDRGGVRLRVRRSGTAEEGRLEVAVEDTGIGIPREAIPRLFRPFSQVHQREGGTGLGLQISRSLARLLGGDILVESEPGKGSVFRLELPLEGERGTLTEMPARSSFAPARALPSALRHRRILVVDDSLENREVLRFLLQEAGATCTTADNGKEGVDRAIAAERAGEPYDAILMDMNMPIMDGFEATRALVQASVSSPVIALTALALSGDENRCLEAGCAAYVGKPIVPSVFFETLARQVRPSFAARARPAPESSPARSGEGTLLSLADHPRFRGLVERYIASFPELVGRIRTLAGEERWEEVRTLVHRLRGTAATYGFPAVSEAAGRCEDAIRSGAGRVAVAELLEELLGRLSIAAAG